MTDKYIDKFGYHVSKKGLKDIELLTLKKELTVSPKCMLGEEPVFFEQFKETNDEIIVPRYFGIKKYGDADLKFQKNKAKIPFISKLRDYQVNITDVCYKHLKENYGGELSVPCGRGKTVMSIYLAHKLKLKTLVIVHQSFLQDQWIDRIKFFTGEDAGIIRQEIMDIENKNIVVGMIQSISRRDYGDIFDQFGLLICDECHHYASQYFSQALSKIGTRYTLGLSATLYRKDGLVKVVHWYLGKLAYKEEMQVNNQVSVKVFNYTSSNKSFQKIMDVQDCMKKCPTFINALVKLKNRNMLLIKIINEIRKNPDRKILILSGRKSSHLPELKNEVDKLINDDIKSGKILEDECKTFFYTGDCKKKERIDAEKNADIIFGTYDMAQEGLDIERLNTIILATPKKDVVQAVGRILRKVLKHGDIRPLVIDVVDNISIFKRHGEAREKFYAERDYQLQYYYVNDKEFISPKKYMELDGYVDEKLCDTVNTNLNEMLHVDNVEENTNNKEEEKEEIKEKKSLKEMLQMIEDDD